MIKIEIIRSLVLEIKKQFNKTEANKILDKIESMRETPKKGKILGTVGGIVIKELRHKGFRIYFLIDGHKLVAYGHHELEDVLLRFVRMSDKKRQQHTIEEIKNVLRNLGEEGF